ncbi:MAG: MBL fold metallo-hydrolase [Comamonas sp.]
MHDHEKALDYVLGDDLPEPSRAIAVAPGIKWVRMGLPFALNHVNLWLVRDELPDARGQTVQGWTVIDCCIDAPAARAQWQTLFVRELEGLPIIRVLVTHMHPDHVGLAHWLCERWRAPLFMSATDYACARLGTLQAISGAGGDAAADFFAAHGLTDPQAVAKIRQRTDYYRQMVPAVPPRFSRLLDGDTLALGHGGARDDWRQISGYGHAPEHIALYSPRRNILIAGDMVLPRISTNVSVYDSEPDADALRLFLSSLDKFRALPADTLVLPSHGKPFKGLHTRIDQLHQHHRERLAEVLAVCRQAPRSAADVLDVLFRRPLDAHQITFAMGESIAHLNWLMHQGQVRRVREDDGVYRFSATA